MSRGWYRPRRYVDQASVEAKRLVDRQRALSVVASCMLAASVAVDYGTVVRLGGLHAWIVLGDAGQATAA